MKKEKLGVVLATLITSSIAAVSGTLAWFTTQRNASISYGSATIGSLSSDLQISFVSSLNSLTHSTNPTNQIDLAYDATITDVSGSGLELYKPHWATQTDENNGVAQSIEKLGMDSAGDADGYFIDFTINITRPSGSTGYKVFLGKDTAIKPKIASNVEDQKVVKAVRMVVLNDDNVVLRYAPEVETGAHYIVADESATLYEVDGFKAQNDAILKSTAFTSEGTIAQAEAKYPAIANLLVEKTADITFRFWVEGEDKDTKNDIKNGVFDISLDIYILEN